MTQINNDSPQYVDNTVIRKKPNAFLKFWFFITLRSYGNDLLTRNGRSYLFGMSLIMLLVSTAEAVAWGYLGSTFSPSHQYTGWILSGLFVFMLMWFFDRSLLTSDLLENEHIKTLNGEVVAKRTSDSVWGKIKIFFEEAWHLKSFFLRLGVVALSIYITAPYMTQIAFKADIENGIQNRYQEAVNAYKLTLIKQMDTELDRIQLKIEQTNNKLQAEISGGKDSQSKRYGFGASAQAIQNELNDLKEEYVAKQAIKTKKIREIEQAVELGNYPALRALGIRIDKDSPVFRNEIVAELEKKEAFWHTEIGIRAFLVILAVILFSMKLMQPRTLKIYYSSLLQEKWNLYCLGRFDDFLPVQDRSQNLLKSHDALPETFEKLIINFFQNKNQHDKWEKEQQEKAERLALEDRMKEQEEAKRQREHDEKIAEQQRALEASRLANARRLLDEKSQEDYFQLKKQWHETQATNALTALDELEQSYLMRHGEEMENLMLKETELEDKLHAIELEFKTHVERVEARRMRIKESEQELAETTNLLVQTRLRDDCDRLQVLRLLEDIEKGLLRQEERIKNQKAELLGFETTQKCVQENLQKHMTTIQKVRTRLEGLEKPLEKLAQERVKIESYRMQLLGEDGVIDPPYLLPTEDEMPYLVKQIKNDMHHLIEDKTVFDNELASENS